MLVPIQPIMSELSIQQKLLYHGDVDTFVQLWKRALVLNFGFIGWKSSKCSFNYIGKFGRVSKAAASVDYVLGKRW